MQIIDSLVTDSAAIAALRRDIHAHPELCFEEVRTADLVARQLTGKTTVIPLVLRVDHQKSFVKGTAFGKNVFDFVQGQVDGKLAKGEIKAEHGPRIRRFLDVCRGLTEAQRSGLVNLLVTDANAK